MSRVKDKVAIVTGGSNGIGRSACLLLAKEGAKVAVTDILDKDSEEVAKLYAKDKIRVNSIHPGAIMTTLLKDFLKTFPGGYEASLEKLVAAHAVGHAGEPDDIGYGILYLASEESKFVTGSQLVIDGGFTAQ